MNIARHGDLLFKTIDKLPKKCRKISEGVNNVLALGEFTGHKHTLVTTAPVKILELGGQKFFEIKETAEVNHDEHKTIKLEPGIYRMTNEREYDYFLEESKKVVD